MSSDPEGMVSFINDIQESWTVHARTPHEGLKCFLDTPLVGRTRMFNFGQFGPAHAL